MNPTIPDSGMWSVSIRQEGDLHLVSLRGAASMEDAENLQERLTIITEKSTPKIILDLSELTFLNSVGLGAIIATHRRCRDQKGKLCIVSPRTAVEQLLRLTHLDRLITIFPDMNSAQKALVEQYK